MANVPAEVLNQVLRIAEPLRRVEEWRRLVQLYPGESKLWFNLSSDLMAVAERMGREAATAARRSVELSPAMYDALSEALRKAVSRPDQGAPEGDAIDRRVGQMIADYRAVRVASRSESEVIYDAVAADGSRSVALRSVFDLEMDALRPYLEKGVGTTGEPGCARRIAVAHDAEGRPWQVLERFDGQTITARYLTSPLSLDESLAIAVRAAELLDGLHKRGLYHGELHPDRVVYQEATRYPELTLLGGVGGVSATVLSLSEERHRWMAPELRFAGATPDARADVYGLGALLYFLVTSRPPPYADDVLPQGSIPVTYDGAVALRGDEVADRSELIDHIDRVIARCLVVQPSRRIAGMRELIDALRG